MNFEQIILKILNEYGIFVTFQLLTIVALLYAIRLFWNDKQATQDRILGIIENNTRVITQLVERLKEGHKNDSND